MWKPDLVAPGNKVVSILSQDGRFRNANPENDVPDTVLPDERKCRVGSTSTSA